MEEFTSEPEVVAEGPASSEGAWRLATLVVLGLTVFVCIGYAAIFLLDPFQSSARAALLNATPTRRGLFAATWTPTPTDTNTPTPTTRPTSTPSRTPTITDTPPPTETPLPVTPTPFSTPTATRTRILATSTSRPRPTNTSTPLPTSTPTPALIYHITSRRSYPNCGGTGVFGTVRDRSENLVAGVIIRLIQGNVALQTRSAGNYIRTNDRNFEMLGIAPGTYTFVAVDEDGRAISPSASVTISPQFENCEPNQSGSQVVQVDLRQM